jgi:hypothetical protein
MHKTSPVSSGPVAKPKPRSKAQELVLAKRKAERAQKSLVRIREKKKQDRIDKARQRYGSELATLFNDLRDRVLVVHGEEKL